MADPISISAIFAFINSAFKFSEYAVKLYGVESENGVFVRLIQTVRRDVEEAERLLCVPSVKKKLISTPMKLPWIKGAIVSAKSALNDIGKWVERVRAEKEGYGRVSWENRVRWVFNDHDKLVHRHMELGTSHQALSTVLSYLAPLEQAEPAAIDTPPLYDHATFFDDFLSPGQRRKKARSDRSLEAGGEVSSGGDGNGRLSNSPSPTPWSTTSRSRSISSPPSAIVEPSSSPTLLPMIMPPATISLTPARANSPRYGEQADIPRPPTSISSWPTTGLSQSITTAQQTDGVTSSRLLNQNIYTASDDPRNTPSHQLTSSTLQTMPYPPVMQQFSATNVLGPIDPFELFRESGTQASLIRSPNVNPVAVDSPFATVRHESVQKPPIPPKIYLSSAPIDTTAKMIEDVSICHPGNDSSRAKKPKDISIAQSPSANSYNGLQIATPSQEMSTSPSSIKGGRRAVWSDSVTELPAVYLPAVENSQNIPQFYVDTPEAACAGTPSHSTTPELPLSQQYSPYMKSQSPVQLQSEPQLQHYGQRHNGAYCAPQVPSISSPLGVLDPISRATPSPLSWQEQRQYQERGRSPVSPPTQEAIAPATAPLSPSRRMTLGETRRRNRKALLASMEYETYS